MYLELDDFHQVRIAVGWSIRKAVALAMARLRELLK